ncbi:hypothetical protein JAAARDRAFT_117059 [Jaapia argillacea MUCL 33604]|uniref:Peptidase A2 domain-containing protein n=1 Tax=Jaapia argillacea MUCL 33604 TaxID=933084 RepID=A0A067QAN2_9AGAM|nr:hypothetical protein JAAARDRAFT_117059 [Jaapia argillacea MUCL 33604]
MCCYVNIKGVSVFALLDSGSITDSLSPGFAAIAKIPVSKLEEPVPLQLGCVGSRSTIQFGTTVEIQFGLNTVHHYFNIVNIDRYDAVLGMAFMRRMGISMDFKHGILKSGSNPITLILRRDNAGISFHSTRELSMEELRKKWMEQCADLLGTIPLELPPLREINHKIPLIDENKHYAYHLPQCAEALKPQLRAKINRYLQAGWWEEATVPQAAPMLTLTKPKSSNIRTVVDCRKRNDNTIKDVTPFPDQDEYATMWLELGSGLRLICPMPMSR